MASRGTRDVNLVIRAKNEASRSFDAISDAGDKLFKSLRELDQTSDGTSSTLETLGTTLGALSKEFGGFNSVERVTRSVDKASTAVASLEKTLDALGQEQARLAEETGKTESSVTGLNNKLRELEKTVSDQTRVKDAAKTQEADFRRAVRETSNEISKAETVLRRYPEQLENAEAQLAKAAARHQELAAKMQATAAPAKSLQDRFEAAEKSVAKYTEKAQQLRDGIEATRSALPGLNAQLETLQGQQAEAAKTATAAADAQSRTAKEIQQTRKAIQTAGTDLSKLARASENTATSIEDTTSALTRARGELQQVEGTAAQANTAMSRIGNTIRLNLLQSLKQAEDRLKSHKDAWQAATAEIRNAVQNGVDMRNPTPDLQASLTTARDAKAAYEQLQVSLQRMRTAMRGAGSDTQALASAQQVFVAELNKVDASADKAEDEVRNLAQATRRQGDESARAATETRKVVNAMDLLSGKGRTTLSLTQRLRGQFLALAASAVGFYEAINQLGNVTRTFRDIEAANTRMSVAFEGNTAVVGREMRFIRSEADRLKVDFRLLAAEYSKLAIATQGTSLAGEQTRDIFVQLSEGFRVANLTADQMQGAFTAITQIVNKGAVSMEELRQQLGERLYGSFQLAARGMGLTTAELSKLIASGQLAAEEFLPRFAAEVQKTFGPQLADALKTLSAELGNFENATTRAQENVANGGFVAGLVTALQELSQWMDSEQGVAFFTNLGAAAGGFLEIAASIPNYLFEISTVFSVLIGFRLAHWLTTLGQRFRDLRTVMQPLPAAIKETNAGLAATNTTARVTPPLMARVSSSVKTAGASMQSFAGSLTLVQARAIAVTGTMNVLRGAFALVGGLPGVIVTGLSVAFSYWLSSTGDVISAMDEHERQMTAVIDAYSLARDKADDWASSVKGVSLAQAETTLTQLRQQLEESRQPLARDIAGELGGTVALSGEDLNGGTFTPVLGEIGREIAALTEEMINGERSVTSYNDALNDIYARTNNERIKQVIRDAQNLISETVKTEQALGEQALVVQSLGGDVGDLSKLLDQLGISMASVTGEAGLLGDEMEDAAAKAEAAQQKLNGHLDSIREKIPSLANALKYDAGIREIDDILKTADAIEGLDKTSESYRQLIELAKQAKAELRLAFDQKEFSGLQSFVNGGDANDSANVSARLLRRFEGFSEQPYYDVNAYRAGFGSDTVTLADGSVQKITAGMRVSMIDANRDLTRRIGEFQTTIVNQIGEERFGEFSPQQQASLTSIAYNYGSLPERIVGAVRDGSAVEIASAIRGLGGDNDGVNRGRRNQEAFLFQAGADPMAQSKDLEESLAAQTKEFQKQVEKAREFHEQLARTLEVKQAEAESDKEMTREQMVQVALTRARAQAQRAGTQLTESEVGNIRQITEANYDRLNSTLDVERAEERIGVLTQTRRDVLTQMDQALNRGDLTAYSELREQLVDLDDVIRDLIKSAIDMWQAMGSDEKAVAAIARLKALDGSIVTVRNQTQLLASDFGEAFGGQLISAGDNFLSKIRETGDVFGSAKDAFRQFASDFLLQIAQMILQQAVFNALSSIGLGGSAAPAGSFTAGLVAAFQHTGGIAGSQGNTTRVVSPIAFTNAVRYHNGGIAGLKPNEVPTVLERGEEVLPETDPRHIKNGGGASGQANVKIVNAIDAGGFLSAGVADSAGQQAILNFMRANKGAVRGALGV